MAWPCGGPGGTTVCADAIGDSSARAAADSHARAGNRGLITLESKPLPRGGKMAIAATGA
jgi:hypothetical protein